MQAGLFSAILSAFLIEVRKGLQEDLQATTNNLLQLIIQNQRDPTSQHTSPITTFEPSPTSRWVNGLWFTSLLFSLLSALGASLAKGWVTQYASAASGTNWRDVCLRHRRLMGIKRWHLNGIAQLLPILIHIAFFLFAAGLAILLIEDDMGIGGVILGLVVVIAFLYIGSSIHPLYSLDSPFRTPVSSLATWISRRPSTKHEFSSPSSPSALKAQALAWLLVESADSRIVEEAIQAIAGLPASPDVQDELYRDSVVSLLSRGLGDCMKSTDNRSMLSAYLFAILRLVQTGPSQRDSPVPSLLLSLVDTLQSIGVHAHGVPEVALCVKGRVLLLFSDDHDTALFKMDLPILLKASPQGHIRRLLLEVFLLYSGCTSITPTPAWSVPLQRQLTILEMVKNGAANIRNKGHEELLKKATFGKNMSI